MNQVKLWGGEIEFSSSPHPFLHLDLRLDSMRMEKKWTKHIVPNGGLMMFHGDESRIGKNSPKKIQKTTP